MRRRSTAIVLGVCGVSCGLFPDLTDLTTNDAAPEATTDAPITDAPITDANDAAACPTIARVQTQAYVAAATNQFVSVTMNLNAGHLVVALFAAQFPGTLSLSDSANTPWTVLTEADNTTCVDDADPWSSRARIAYATVPANFANDNITLTTAGAPDYLTLTVADYVASSGTLAYTTSNANSATSSTSTITLPPLTTSGCANLVVAMLADEFPSGDKWTPLAGFDVLSSADDWSFATIEDLAAPQGNAIAGAMHLASESCWATAGASFAAQ